jgi:acetoin utilization protein AcuB
MTAQTLASRPVLVLDVRDNCRRAAELMNEHQVRHLPVMDGGVPVGMVSDRDLLASIGWWRGTGKHPGAAIPNWADRLPVEEVMSGPLICVAPEDSLEKAAWLMLTKRISAVPVVGQGRLLGIVTETDCLRLYTGERAWQQQGVVAQMTASVFRITPGEPIHRAWRLMRDRRIRHLVVSQEERLLGILSDRDILAGITWEAAGPKGIQDQVRHIMTSQVATIAPEATVTDAARAMSKRRIGALPVCDEGRLVGIITETDLLRVFVASSGTE